MSEDFIKIESGETRFPSSEIAIYELPLSTEVRTAVKAKGFPSTLFLGITRHKEYPPGYRHAWGNAWISSTKDGAHSHSVELLRLRIEMPEALGTNVSDLTCNNCASIAGDCKFFGSVLGDFQSSWTAWASDSIYGQWSIRGRW